MDNTTAKIYIDLTPFICESFASNKKIYKLIDSIYEKDHIEYYQLAKNNVWYNHEILTCQSIEKEILMKKALGIILECDSDKMLKIINKGWKQLYSLIKPKSIIKLSEVLKKTLPIQNINHLYKMTNDELNAYGTISIVLSRLLDKEIDVEDSAYKTIMNYYHKELKWADEGAYRFSYTSIPTDSKNKIKTLKERIYAEYNLNRYWISFTSTDVPEEINKYIQGFSFLFDVEKLSTSIIEEEVLSERDIEEILSSYFVVSGNLNKESAVKFLVAGHIIRALLRAYKNLKQQYFKNNKETLYLDLDTAKHEASVAKNEAKRLEDIIVQKNKEIESLQRQVKSEYSRAVAEYREKLKEAIIKTEDLEQQIIRLKSENEDLKTALFDSAEEITESFEPVDLAQYRGVIVGGHTNWHKRMKEILPPNWRFIHPDDRLDLSILPSADFVFFYTNYLSHAVFIPVIAEARKKDIPIGYLRRINDVECVIDIQKIISNQVKTKESHYKE